MRRQTTFGVDYGARDGPTHIAVDQRKDASASWRRCSRLAILCGMSDITRILSQIEHGDPQAAEQLLPLVYDELRKLAALKIAQERPGQTLQATALVHEAYLRLVTVRGTSGQEPGAAERSPGATYGNGPLAPNAWNSRGHFFAAAAEAMRRILVESARRKGREKSGGGWQKVTFDEIDVAQASQDWDLLALDEALTELEREHPLHARLVKLRFFAGLTLDQAAAAMEISPATADRYWKYAQAWLAARLREGE